MNTWKQLAEAYEVVRGGLGARPWETLQRAARRVRYHGHERAQAAELILSMPDAFSKEDQWRVLSECIEILRPRMERDAAQKRLN